MSAKDTFIAAVERCQELPETVREATKNSAIEEHSFDQSYIQFLDTQIELSPRGPDWTERLKKRREGLFPFTGKHLLRSIVEVGTHNYSIEVDPRAESVGYWERYENVRGRT